MDDEAGHEEPSKTEEAERVVLVNAIHNSIQSSQTFVDRYRTLDFWLHLINIISGIFATAFAGGGAAGGADFAQLLGESPQGWQRVCLAACLCSLLAVISSTIRAQFDVSGRRASGIACLMKLRLLEIDLIQKRQVSEVGEEYKKISMEYPNVLAGGA